MVNIVYIDILFLTMAKAILKIVGIDIDRFRRRVMYFICSGMAPGDIYEDLQAV